MGELDDLVIQRNIKLHTDFKRTAAEQHATDVGMHGILASHHSVLPSCWFTLRASDRATLPSLHPSDFDRNLF